MKTDKIDIIIAFAIGVVFTAFLIGIPMQRQGYSSGHQAGYKACLVDFGIVKREGHD